MAIYDYRIEVEGRSGVARGSSPRVAIERALAQLYGRTTPHGARDTRLDNQLAVGQQVIIKCTRVK